MLQCQVSGFSFRIQFVLATVDHRPDKQHAQKVPAKTNAEDHVCFLCKYAVRPWVGSVSVHRWDMCWSQRRISYKIFDQYLNIRAICVWNLLHTLNVLLQVNKHLSDLLYIL